MSGKIFYRERTNVKDGAKKPRFRIIAIADCNLKVYSDHLRMSELEHIAQETKAELVQLRSGVKKEKVNP